MRRLFPMVLLPLVAASGLCGQETEIGQGQSAAAPAEAAVQAAVPRLIMFSGTLRDLAGKPITGPVDVTFGLYSEETDGSPLWFETQTLQADHLGHYNVMLGAMSPAGVPMELFTEGEARWLGVMVEGLPEQARVLLVSVPYALKAGDAETLGGKPASAYLLSSQAETQTSTAAAAGTLSGLITANGTTATTTRGKTSPQSITPGGSANYLAAWLDSSNLGTSVIYQDPTTNNIGIGTTTPASADSLARTVQIGDRSVLQDTVAYQTTIANNAHYDGGSWKYIVGSPAAAIRLNGLGPTGDITFSTAPNGAAGSSIGCWDSSCIRMVILNGGNVGVGTTSPVSTLHVLTSGTTPAQKGVAPGDAVAGECSGSSCYAADAISQGSGGVGIYAASTSTFVPNQSNAGIGIFAETYDQVNGWAGYFVGDISIWDAPGAGIYLRSPDGTHCASITLSNTGALTTTSVSCPTASISKRSLAARTLQMRRPVSQK
ncbi:MAG: hypothetical protein ACM3NO_08255 [Deltaproteobacteria bacterium]